MIQRLAHLCFRTDRFEAMTAFYRDVLGLPVHFTLNHDDGTVFGIYFRAGGSTFLELFDQRGAVRQWGGEIAALCTPSDAFYQHFCLEVAGLEAFRERLLQQGVAVTAIATGLDHSRQCWLHDPDGNAIELMEYTPASLQLHPSGPPNAGVDVN